MPNVKISKLEKHQVAFVSIGHLNASTIENLLKLDFVMRSKYAIQFYIGDGLESTIIGKQPSSTLIPELLECGDEMQDIISHFTNKCQYINFDRDADPVKCLRTFDW